MTFGNIIVELIRCGSIHNLHVPTPEILGANNIPRAIAFIVFEPNLHKPNWIDDVSSFYDWFLELEETSFLEDVTLAPFHPKWTYNQQKDAVLDLEKQSPYPTVSLVSTAVIEKAGEAATARIAADNETILRQRTLDEWKDIYNSSIRTQS